MKIIAQFARQRQDEINQRELSQQQLHDQLGARTVAGGAIAVIAQFVRFALQVGGTATLAHLMAPSEFGLVAMASTVMAFIAVITELNVTTAAVQREEIDQDMASALMQLVVLASCIAYVLAVAAIPVAVFFFKDQRLPAVILGLGASLPIYGFGALHNALLTRNMRWASLQIASLSGLAFGIAAAVIAAWLFHAGYWALVIQSSAAATASTVAAWLLCPWRPNIVRDWSAARSSLKFGFHLTASQILNYFHQQLDNILIGARWGSVELGFYSRAYNLLTTPLNFLTGPLGSTMIPALSRLYREPEKWRAAYLDALAVIAIAGAGMAGLLYGGASSIIEIVLGPQWEHVKPIFSNLVLGMFATSTMSTTGWIYISSARTDRMFQWSMVGVPIYVTSFLIGLPYGGVGVAFCYSISRFLAFLPAIWMATRDTNVSVRDIVFTAAPPTLAAAVIAAGLSRVCAHLGPWAGLGAVALAGLIYSGLVLIAVLHLSVYKRLRERGLALARSAFARMPKEA